MPQLLFEPSATKIGDDFWLVVPKNNFDSIDVYENPQTESEESNEETEPVTDIRTGSYKIVLRCNTLAKDIIMAMWGNPTGSNDVYAGHTHTANIVETLCSQYENIWLPDEVTGKYIIEGDESNAEFDTLEEAMTVEVNRVKVVLRNTQIQEVEEDAESSDNE